MAAPVYLGTSDFAAGILRRLVAAGHRPALVLSRPDAPQGRGRRLAAPPVIEAARQLGLDTDQPASVNTPDTLERIHAAGADGAVVCAFGALIREPLLSAFEILNVHPSRLPRWRGAAPIERAIMAGDPETGVAIMQLTAGLDEGPVYALDRVAIGPEDTYADVAGALERRGAELLIDVLVSRPHPTPQPADGVTYAEKITAEDRRLDPGAGSARQLADRVRGLSPHIGAFLEPAPGGGRLGVWRARPVTATGAGTDGPVFVRCAGDTVLELLEVQPPGKRRMPAADWARGLGR